MDLEIITDILTLHQKMYIDHTTACAVVNIVLNFMSYAKNKNKRSGSQALETTHTIKYPEQVADAWKKVREPTYFANKGHLRILSYIVAKPKGHAYQYGGCFQQLQFDLSL